MIRQSNSARAARREIVASMQGVSRHFERPSFVSALRRVSFGIHQGEIFGLLRPGDSGKSTILRILAGRLRPSEGKVKVFGRSPRQRSVKARVGFLAGIRP